MLAAELSLHQTSAAPAGSERSFRAAPSGPAYQAMAQRLRSQQDARRASDPSQGRGSNAGGSSSGRGSLHTSVAPGGSVGAWSGSGPTSPHVTSSNSTPPAPAAFGGLPEGRSF